MMSVQQRTREGNAQSIRGTSTEAAGQGGIQQVAAGTRVEARELWSPVVQDAEGWDMRFLSIGGC